MTNAYLIGADILGATAISRDLNALLNATPMSAAEGRRLVDLSLALVGDPTDARTAGLAQMLRNMGESIESRWVDPLPEAAAELLRQTVRDAVAAQDVVGARTKQTRATLGPRGRAVVGSASGWDNTQTYPTGSYAYNNGRYYRALRDVTPPFLPTLQSGDVPGDSDAWREVSAQEATGNKNVLGASAGITDWDKTSAYDAGAVVRYWGSYYKAQRPVSGASILWGNDTPDKSDAWAEVAASSVIYGDDFEGLDDVDQFADGDVDILGDEDEDDFEVLGMLDIGQAQIKMNALPKQLPATVAQPLLRYGQQVIAQAIALADQKSLPGPTARNEVMWKLKWHEGELGKLALTPQAIYASAADLEHWVMQAFIESNAVEEGAAWIDGAWGRMWAEIGAAWAALPKEIVQTIAKLPGQVFEAATGIPSWAFWVGGAAIIGIVGYGAYQILRGPAGGAVVGHYLGRR